LKGFENKAHFTTGGRLKGPGAHPRGVLAQKVCWDVPSRPFTLSPSFSQPCPLICIRAQSGLQKGASKGAGVVTPWSSTEAARKGLSSPRAHRITIDRRSVTRLLWGRDRKAPKPDHQVETGRSVTRLPFLPSSFCPRFFRERGPESKRSSYLSNPFGPQAYTIDLPSSCLPGIEVRHAALV